MPGSVRKDCTRQTVAAWAVLLERWKDSDRNNRRAAGLRLVSPVGAPSHWQLTLTGRVRHVAVTVTVTEFTTGPTAPAVGWVESDPDAAYRIELAPVGGTRPGLDAVVRTGVETWAGLDAGRIALRPALPGQQ